MKRQNLAMILLCILLVFTNLITLYAQAPLGWRDLPNFYVFKDKVSGWSGSGGELEVVNGNLPVDTQVTFEALPSIRFQLLHELTSGWMSAILVMAEWNSHDVTRYVPNGYLEFNVKGRDGGENFKIGAVDHVEERASGVEKTIFVELSRYGSVTTNWQHIKIPLKDILSPSLGMDPYNAKAILLDRVTNSPFCVWINQLKLTSPDKEEAFPAIKVNQVGFQEATEKYAFVTGFEDDFHAAAGTAFHLKNASNNSVAYSGQLTLVSAYDQYDSGEVVLKADFSDFRQPGQYYISVDAPGIENSPRFKIGNNVFEDLLIDVSRYFFYQRANIDLAAPYVTDYPRQDKTPEDFNCPMASNPGIIRDVSKGWYDAGDPNKYIVTGAVAAASLLSAYELYPEVFKDNQNNIPESGNGVPDILDEVRWELEWILKMQEAQSGGFYCRVSFDENFTEGNRVIMDFQDGVSNIKSTIDTASAVGILAHASLLYEDFDSSFSQQCLSAAIGGWNFLKQHPNNIRAPEGPYATDDDQRERFWAAAALFRVTNDTSCHDYIKANYQKLYETPSGDGSFGWENGFYNYMKARSQDSTIKTWFESHFASWAQNKLNRYKANPWGNVIENGNYYWGSNSIVLGCSREVLIGSHIFGANPEEAGKFTRSSLNWILGANPMRKSFVSGYGDDAIKLIFSSWAYDGLPGIPQGIMPGGPNKYNGEGLSIFPAKCYEESQAEFTTNEHTLGWNSILAYVVAFANADITQEPQGLLGDVNDDKVINIVDTLMIAQRYVGIPINGVFIEANADVNCDNVINIVDGLLVAQYYVGMIDSFCR
ncbi:MAG: glycoside hydrolase family 9 protein [Spirochaetales bacterium]|nr:glycoside hydrolase family 9 protein [Spirochaetales bacterium]